MSNNNHITKDFFKVINPGSVQTDTNSKYKHPMFIKIEYKDGKLSLSGVIGPKSNGDAYGGCGQILDELLNPEIELSKEWTKEMVFSLYTYWKKYHLNDMQAGCEHQRELLWKNERIKPEELPNSYANRDEKGILSIWVTEKEHPKGLLSKPCPVCGYKYGSKWLSMDIPENVLSFLDNLPETNKRYVWI